MNFIVVFNGVVVGNFSSLDDANALKNTIELASVDNIEINVFSQCVNTVNEKAIKAILSERQQN